MWNTSIKLKLITVRFSYFVIGWCLKYFQTKVGLKMKKWLTCKYRRIQSHRKSRTMFHFVTNRQILNICEFITFKKNWHFCYFKDRFGSSSILFDSIMQESIEIKNSRFNFSMTPWKQKIITKIIELHKYFII